MTTTLPNLNPTPAPRRFWHNPWVHGLLVFFLIALIVVALIAGYLRLRRYSQDALQARMRQAALVIDFTARPNHLDPAILNSILKDAQLFALQTVPSGKPDVADPYNYDRLRDPLDSQVLRELAQHYADHAAERNNAWIKGPVSARRVYDSNRNIQFVYLAVEFRRPAAVVVEGENYYMIDTDLVRLPGRYTARDVAPLIGRNLPGTKRAIFLIGGVDESIPESPGHAWASPGGRAALDLANLLSDKPYASQIAQINLANFTGRRDRLAARIVLLTIWGTEVRWGLPIERHGLERAYEINPEAKLRVLDQIFAQYSRIDARAPYVDIRGDQTLIPKVTESPRPEESPPPRRRPT